MNRAILSQRITSILADLNRLTNALYAMNTTDDDSSNWYTGKSL